MIQKQTYKKCNSIISILIIVFIVCVAVLFPQVRQMIFGFLAEHVIHKETPINPIWNEIFFKFAITGIFFILFFIYCIFTGSGKLLVEKVKQEINDCIAEIDFRSLLKPSLILFGVYLLGILTIIRANFLYKDDVWRATEGLRVWINWSRYITEFFSIFVHADTNLTEISPLTQLLAIFLISVSSVLLVYILTRKITVIRLLASIPLGLFPYFLECLSYKFDSIYMALSVFVCIFPFLFIARKKAFLLVSIISLLIMCMTYQPSSGIYMLIVVILCFQYWNRKEKSNKEILSFLGLSAFAFCFAMLFFRFFLMKPVSSDDVYAFTTMHPISQIISGTLNNIINYAKIINNDLGVIWKIGIVLVLLFFITKAIHMTAQKKIFSFFASILFIVLSFILSYGVYSLLALPLFYPRALYGFGVFLAIMCIYIVSDYKKIAVISVLALNWCFLVFAFSYGNALADQKRYREFRIGLLLNDLNTLNLEQGEEKKLIQIDNFIEFTPLVKNIAKHYPVIEKLVSYKLNDFTDYFYFLIYFNYDQFSIEYAMKHNIVDFNDLNLPVVLDSYYHTIQSDGNRVLIVLKR